MNSRRRVNSELGGLLKRSRTRLARQGVCRHRSSVVTFAGKPTHARLEVPATGAPTTATLRVVAEEKFVNYGNASDQYGHGTHIVSLARGNGRIANAAYVGITRRGLQLKLGRYAMSATSSV